MAASGGAPRVARRKVDTRLPGPGTSGTSPHDRPRVVGRSTPGPPPAAGTPTGAPYTQGAQASAGPGTQERARPPAAPRHTSTVTRSTPAAVRVARRRVRRGVSSPRRGEVRASRREVRASRSAPRAGGRRPTPAVARRGTASRRPAPERGATSLTSACGGAGRWRDHRSCPPPPGPHRGSSGRNSRTIRIHSKANHRWSPLPAPAPRWRRPPPSTLRRVRDSSVRCSRGSRRPHRRRSPSTRRWRPRP